MNTTSNTRPLALSIRRITIRTGVTAGVKAISPTYACNTEMTCVSVQVCPG